MRGRLSDASIKDRRHGAAGNSSWQSSYCAFFLFLGCFALFSVLALSSFRLYGVAFQPVIVLPTWRNPAMRAVFDQRNSLSRRDLRSSNSSSVHLQIEQAVSFPDQVLLFLKPRTLIPIPPLADLNCFYLFPKSMESHLSLPALSFSTAESFIRCPRPPSDRLSFNISLSLSSSLPPISPLPSDRLAYASILDDMDNSTIIFAKGHNLRPARLSNPNSFECIFGWDFSRPKYHLTSDVLSAAQEIFRCRTPLSILRRRRLLPSSNSPLVSVRFKAHGAVPLPSIARPEPLIPPSKPHLMCVCTMLRNQARFLREWIIYHSHIGVERWFIYDNNSDDDIVQIVERLSSDLSAVITLHEWPWAKTQEAGFAHCAVRARESCKWVGFIDVDEFLYFPTNSGLHDLLKNYSRSPRVAELRTACHSFGPSGRKTDPPEGVMAGYTCRISPPERHKSIVRPDALNPSLVNIVHHFHLRDGMKYVNVDVRKMVINHYKYQVWEVFKQKFYRRVATYVADWKDDENKGSKDRAPGLGTTAVEPLDWASRFCEVKDTGLRDWVLRAFADPSSGRFPW